MDFKKNKGFTLIELLVVIAIIGLLSSVVLASLNNARLKGRDSAILNQMIQFRNIVELDYARIGNYTGLQLGWVTSLANCDAKYPPASTIATIVEANKLCRSIYATSANDPTGYPNGERIFVGNQTSPVTKYSMMVYLPGKKSYQCVGSSGVSTVAFQQWYTLAAPAGCYGNP